MSLSLVYFKQNSKEQYSCKSFKIANAISQSNPYLMTVFEYFTEFARLQVTKNFLTCLKFSQATS